MALGYYGLQLEQAVNDCLESIPFPYSKGVELRLFPNQPTESPVEKVYDGSQDDPSFSLLDLAKCLNPPVEHNCDDVIDLILFSSLTEIHGEFHRWEVWKAVIINKDNTDAGKCLESQQMVVVKIFDTVYYFEDYLNLYKRFLQAYKLYFSETRSYKIGKSAQGIYIPQFYGSYALNVPGQGRSVYAIVEEYFPGYSLDQLDPKKFCRDMKFQIICRVLQCTDFLQSLGLFLRDNHPRNAIIRQMRPDTDGGAIEEMNCVGDLSESCSKCCREPHLPEIRLIDFEIPSLYLSDHVAEDLARTVDRIRNGEFQKASRTDFPEYAGALLDYKVNGWLVEPYLKVIQRVRLGHTK